MASCDVAIQYTVGPNRRETAGRAAADLKADVLASLCARLELLMDEADREADEQAAGSKQRHALSEGAALPSKATQLALPRRVWVQWVDGAAVCDYLVHGVRPARHCLPRHPPHLNPRFLS